MIRKMTRVLIPLIFGGLLFSALACRSESNAPAPGGASERLVAAPGSLTVRAAAPAAGRVKLGIYVLL